MPTAVTPDLARNSLTAFLVSAQHRQDLSPEEAREFLASHTIPVAVLEALDQLVQKFLDQGIESKHLCFLLKEFLDVLELAGRAFAAARERVATTRLAPEEMAEGVLKLDQAARRALALHQDFSALLRRFVPWEVNPASLPEDRGEENAPGFVSLDDFTSRLLS